MMEMKNCRKSLPRRRLGRDNNRTHTIFRLLNYNIFESSIPRTPPKFYESPNKKPRLVEIQDQNDSENCNEATQNDSKNWMEATQNDSENWKEAAQEDVKFYTKKFKVKPHLLHGSILQGFSEMYTTPPSKMLKRKRLHTPPQDVVIDLEPAQIEVLVHPQEAESTIQRSPKFFKDVIGYYANEVKRLEIEKIVTEIETEAVEMEIRLAHGINQGNAQGASTKPFGSSLLSILAPCQPGNGDNQSDGDSQTMEQPAHQSNSKEIQDILGGVFWGADDDELAGAKFIHEEIWNSKDGFFDDPVTVDELMKIALDQFFQAPEQA